MGTDAPTPPLDEPQTTDVAPPAADTQALPGAPDAAADAAATPPAEVVSSPPADTAELPAWAANETADPGAIRAIEQGNAPDRPEEVASDTTLPDGNEAVQSQGKVLVSPSDPELGGQIAEWLERQAARDARLSPLVERLHFLPNVLLSFEADDPALARPAETTAA